MGIFNFLPLKKKEVETKVQHQEQNSVATKAFKKESFRVSGLPYHEESIMKPACSNPEWAKSKAKLIEMYAEDVEKLGRPAQVYRYTFICKPVKLVPDPKNEYDKNTVTVFIAGEKIGWVQGDDGKRLSDIVNNGSIKYISAYIGGGEFKSVALNDVTKSERGFSARISIGYIL